MDNLTQDKLIRATRIWLGLLIGFVYVTFTDVSDGFWVYITIALVLFDSTTIGGSKAKGSSRSIGTLIAAIYSMVFILGFNNNFVFNIIGIILGIFLSVYLFMDTKTTYGGLLTWTLPVLLINDNDIKSSFLRFLNIMIGALIAYFMNRMFFPSRAHKKMLASMKTTMVELANLYQLILSPTLDKQMVSTIVAKSGSAILGEIGKFPKWQEEARIENYYTKEQIDAAVKAYVYIRHLFRLINVAILYFDFNQVASYENEKIQFIKISNQINAIIQLLEVGLIDNIWPEELILPQHKIQYTHSQDISLHKIYQPIQEELDGIIVNLAIVYK